MSAFYQRITASHATADALRHAQIELLHHQTTAHPYYWAPFLLNGASRIWQP